MNIDQLERKDYDFIWVTHLAGLANDMQTIVDIADRKGVHLAEDCCQAYGATVDGAKVGTFGIASTSSFYFGHHMTTIEGGMLSFNVAVAPLNLISASEAIRSHGLSRAITDSSSRAQVESGFEWVDNRFLFSHLPMNFRNTEIQAILGRNQLKRLDHFVSERRSNFEMFSEILRTHSSMPSKLNIVKELPNTKNSSFCLPFVFNNSEDKNKFVESSQKLNAFETRPLAGGPIQLQPAFVQDMRNTQSASAFVLYSNTIYIGNNHMIESNDWQMIYEVWKDAFE
jgi:CDP-6-deoxy-D-xylo-4-hexulose-3-dehydrase